MVDAINNSSMVIGAIGVFTLLLIMFLVYKVADVIVKSRVVKLRNKNFRNLKTTSDTKDILNSLRD